MKNYLMKKICCHHMQTYCLSKSYLCAINFIILTTQKGIRGMINTLNILWEKRRILFCHNNIIFALIRREKNFSSRLFIKIQLGCSDKSFMRRATAFSYNKQLRRRGQKGRKNFFYSLQGTNWHLSILFFSLILLSFSLVCLALV